MACEVNEKQQQKKHSHRWLFRCMVCFLLVGMCRFSERGVVITCVPVTVPVGKQVYFYQHRIAKEMQGRRRKRGVEMGLPQRSSVWDTAVL